MKKFSVLLVILLLATPLLAYGLTADYDEGGIPLQTVFYSREAKEVNEAPPAFVADEQGEPGDEEIPPMEDPFFPEPDGFKGTVKDIDYDHNKITISEVHYFNNYTQTYEFAESYTILFNQYTDFVIDGESGRTINDIITGEPVTAIGEADYEKKTVTSTAAVYQGETYNEEEWRDIPINGLIQSINPDANTFTIQCVETAKVYNVTIDENTQFLKEFINNQNEKDAELLATGVFPSEFKTDVFCTVFAKAYQNLEATAFDVLIIDTDHS